MIILDWTLGASALIFLLTLVALNRILFRPLFRVLEQRRAATTGALANAEDGQELYQAKVDEYEDRLRSERQAGYQQAEETRQEGLRQKQARVSEARAKAEAQIQEAHDRLDAELEKAKAQLQKEAEQIASAISQKVLHA